MSRPSTRTFPLRLLLPDLPDAKDSCVRRLTDLTSQLAGVSLAHATDGAIDAEETAEVRRHTWYTYDILSRVTRFQRFAPLAAAHHERMDGTGYHLGLQGADLSIEKSADVTSATPGSTVTYTLAIRNGGPGSAADVRATDTLPSGTTYVAASAPCTQADRTVTCDLGTLAAGETRTVTIKATVDPVPVSSGDTTHRHQLDITKVESHLSAFDDESLRVRRRIQQARTPASCRDGRSA